MTAFRALIVAFGLVSLFTGSTMWAKHSTPEPITVVRPYVDSTAVLDNVVKSGTVHDDDWADPRVDVNGNEIDNAVGDYRVDPRGEMYERHAPDTALPRLGAPQM
jgi:hypothetical protein